MPNVDSLINCQRVLSEKQLPVDCAPSETRQQDNKQLLITFIDRFIVKEHKVSMMEKVNSSTTLQRKLMCLSGGCLLDPHVDSGLNYNYFPMDSVFKFNLVEDLILWKQGYSSHLEESLLHALKPEEMINVDTMIICILFCLFAKSQAILEHFYNFEEIFEKSSVISRILRTVSRKHQGAYLDVILCKSVMKIWFYSQ